MRRRGGLLMLLAAVAVAVQARPDDHYGYGHDKYDKVDHYNDDHDDYGHHDHHDDYGHHGDDHYGRHEVDNYGHHGYDDHHEDGYGHHKGEHDGYGHEPKCEKGFYGQCKKDKWGRCIQPDIVGVWELTEGKPDEQYSNQRWIMQFDEYDFCKQTGNYAVTNGKGLTESVAYGTYVWEDKKYWILKDYSFIYGYKYPYPIVGTVTWKSDFKLLGYDKAKSAKPAIGITKDLHGKVIDKEYTQNYYRKLKGPHEGIEY
eukprot:Selendium_serpulae@DN6345_c0_g1_i1.p1